MMKQQRKFCRPLFSLLFGQIKLFGVMRKMAYIPFVVPIETFVITMMLCYFTEFMVTGTLFGNSSFPQKLKTSFGASVVIVYQPG
jgi:hypothetical protein